MKKLMLVLMSPIPFFAIYTIAHSIFSFFALFVRQFSLNGLIGIVLMWIVFTHIAFPDRPYRPKKWVKNVHTYFFAHIKQAIRFSQLKSC